MSLAGVTTPALCQQVQISKLSDVAFGTINNVSVDALGTQNLCVYSSTATKGYNVRGSGSGAGGSFTLAAATLTIPYEVQWNASSGQTSGTSLTAGTTLTGLKSTATSATCTKAPLTTASLIVIIRAATLAGATATTYSGTLTLLVGPE